MTVKTSDNLEIELDKILSSDDNKLLETFLKTFVKGIEGKYDLKNKKIKLTLEEKDENFLPSSIFTIRLGILESCVKYLHENKKLDFKQISKIVKRTPNNISVTYQNSKIKHKNNFTDIDFSTKIPYEIFNKKFTCFESICIYLKDKQNLKFSEIAESLNRDDRTIWTVYNRAVKKKKGDSK